MGFFKSKEERAQESAEIVSRIQHSECGQLFANAFCGFFEEGGDYLQWLMANSRERQCKIEVFSNGVSLKRIEVNKRRLNETGTYDVDSQGWSFGASGFQDLPNSKYVNAFRQFLFDSIQNHCPCVRFISDNTIVLGNNVKKGW